MNSEMGTVAEQVRNLELGAGHAGERRTQSPLRSTLGFGSKTHYLGPKRTEPSSDGVIKPV